ncbi:MAG TPA: GntG family PLP-dependent aldolase [candidate division Zixibacteria bacterium]|jgi:threonine aldolase
MKSVPHIVDLRSDTVTRPTPGMYEAMMSAPVGDDVFEDDPTVRKLEDTTAALFGVEAALFVPSGTMGNQVSLFTHARPGDELICDDDAHIDWYEVGAPAVLSRLMVRPIPAPGGIPDVERIRAAIRPVNIHHPRTGIVAVENTHNRAGGVIVPLAVMRAVAQLARERDIRCHLDGARIWNAHAATGIPLRDWMQGFDSASVCYSKGLGAPVGSAVLGSREFITRARRTRKMFGGGMRQVGVLAAACLWALEHQLPLMPEDHKRAQTLAARIATIPGLHLIPDPPPTNIVVIDIEKTGHAVDSVLPELRSKGVLMVAFGPTRIRAVTHRDVNDDDIARAADSVHSVLTSR